MDHSEVWKASLLESSMSNFRAIGQLWTQFSCRRDFLRSGNKTSYCLMNRGADDKRSLCSEMYSSFISPQPLDSKHCTPWVLLILLPMNDSRIMIAVFANWVTGMPIISNYVPCQDDRRHHSSLKLSFQCGNFHFGGNTITLFLLYNGISDTLAQSLLYNGKFHTLAQSLLHNGNFHNRALS